MEARPYIYRIKAYQEDTFWERLQSQDLSERFTALHEAKTALVGTYAAKCYFMDRGIGEVIRNCLSLEGDSKEISLIRLEATLVCGCVAKSPEHATLLFDIVGVRVFTRQLKSGCDALVEATLATLSHLCSGRVARTSFLSSKDVYDLVPLIERERPSFDDNRVSLLAAKLLSNLHLPQHVAAYFLEDGILPALLKQFSLAPRPQGVHAILELVVELANAKLPSLHLTADCRRYALFSFHKLFSNSVLYVHLRDVSHPRIQILAAQLILYNSLVLKQDAEGHDSLMLQRRLLPALVRIAFHGDKPIASTCGCRALYLIAKLLHHFPDDLQHGAYHCEGFVNEGVEKVNALLVEDSKRTIPSEMGETFSTYFVECLAEMCSSSEPNRVLVSKVPLVIKWISDAGQKVDAPAPVVNAFLRLVHVLSRSIELVRSSLIDAEAWHLVCVGLVAAPRYIKHRPDVVICACSALANLILGVSPMRQRLFDKNADVLVMELLQQVMSEAILAEPDRSLLVTEILSALHNAMVRVASPPPPLLDELKLQMLNQVWKQAFQVLDPEQKYSSAAKEAALSYICQLEYCFQGSMADIKVALTWFHSSFQHALEQGHWEVVFWSLTTLRHMLDFEVVVKVVYENEEYFQSIRTSLEHGRKDVQAQAIRVVTGLLQATTRPGLESFFTFSTRVRLQQNGLEFTLVKLAQTCTCPQIQSYLVEVLDLFKGG